MAKKKTEKSTSEPNVANGEQPSATQNVPEKPAAPVKPAQPAKAAKLASKSASTKAAKGKSAGKSSKAAKPKPTTAGNVKAPARVTKKPRASANPKVPLKAARKALPKAAPDEKETILDSQVAYEGKLFRVLRDHIIEPGGRESHREVIRHNGSVVILAVDPSKRKKDPWIVIERQYRHAAGQFLWELPAGKLDAGEVAMDGAKRELAEETGYQARKWSPLVEYYASPGFLGESMNVFLAEGLVAGDAHPEEDEHIDFRLVKLSDLLDMVDKGKIIDGKTLTTILLYARQLGLKRKK
jgi:ADP-ribose pyrophosphatase